MSAASVPLNPWVPDPEQKVLCIMTICASAMSFIACGAALVMYAKYRRAIAKQGDVRSDTESGFGILLEPNSKKAEKPSVAPSEDTLMTTIAFGFLCSINYLLSAILHLSGNLKNYCDLSAFLVQLLFTPESILEGVFFVIVSIEIRRAVTTRHVRLATAACLLIGVVLAVIPVLMLPHVQTNGTQFGNGLPWCWLPDYDDPAARTQSVGLVLAKVLGGFVWPLIAGIAGLFSFMYLYIQLKARESSVPLTVKLRVVYFLIFAASWTVFFVNRSVAARMSDVTHRNMVRLQAVLEPGLGGINAIFFIISERLWTFANEKRIISAATEEYVSLSFYESGTKVETPQRRFSTPAITEVRVEYNHDEQVWSLIKSDDRSEDPTTIPILSSEISKVLTFKKPPLQTTLSFLAGYCDCCGFLSMLLFTAHVTGNWAIIAMGITKKESFNVIVPPTMALLVFACTVVVTHIADRPPGQGESHHGLFGLVSCSKYHARLCIGAQIILLTTSFFVAHFTGPFLATGNNPGTGVTSPGAFGAGLPMVAAMAIQNVFQRRHMPGGTLTTIMTGNTVVILMDAVDIIQKAKSEAELGDCKRRLKNTLLSLTCFFVGGGLATFIYYFGQQDRWVFFPPPLVASIVLFVFWDELAPPQRT